MHGSAHPDEQRIEWLRERRRRLAAQIRSLLQQLDTLEAQFEAAKRELQQATGGRVTPPSA